MLYASPKNIGRNTMLGIDILLDADAMNVDIAALAQSEYGWDGLKKALVNVSIKAGIKIGSNDPVKPALTTGVWPEGSLIDIDHQGRIVGMGGAGATLRVGAATHGQDGGDALQVLTTCTLTGFGEVWAGGGGGGCGGYNNGYREDGAGGGGAGFSPGAGGVGFKFRNGDGWGGAHVGKAGTETLGGDGGAAANDVGPKNTVKGGDGGNPGENGQGARGALGGKAGFAIDGDALLTNNATFDIKGAMQ